MAPSLRRVVAAAFACFAVTVAASTAGAVDQGDRERWQDDAGASQGVEFTRNIQHTQVPTFFDQRAATFSCDNGQSFDDPLVVISAGDGSSDINLPIASDGSFSYSGPATMTNGNGTMELQGRFAGTAATGTVHWTAHRSSNGTSCSADSGSASWSAHCAEQCGGASAGGITVVPKGKLLIGQWSLLDIHVQADGAGRLAAFVHHDGSRACGTFTDEDGAAAQTGRHGPVERLGEAQVPGAGAFTFHTKYIPDQFGRSDRVCAYLTQASAGETVLAAGEGSPRVGFALPWAANWFPLSRRTLKPGIYSLATPYKNVALRGTSPGFNIVGTWGCDGGLQRSGKLAGRRWWLGASTLSKAIKLTPIRPRPDGSFAFSGKAHPDLSNNYDAPIPKKWPSRSMHVSLSGRFAAGHGELGRGVVNRASMKLTVVNGGRTCRTKLKLRGDGALSDLPGSTEKTYSGTLTNA